MAIMCARPVLRYRHTVEGAMHARVIHNCRDAVCCRALRLAAEAVHAVLPPTPHMHTSVLLREHVGTCIATRIPRSRLPLWPLPHLVLCLRAELLLERAGLQHARHVRLVIARCAAALAASVGILFIRGCLVGFELGEV